MPNTISAIIPTYNRARYLTRAINSVLIQLKPDDELIVVDDGSTDTTERVVARFGSRIRYIKTTNSGAGASRNRGVCEAKSALVAFADSDDEWLPGKIQLQRTFMKDRPDILFCFSNFGFWNKSGTVEPFSLKSWHTDNRSWPQILGQEGTPYSRRYVLPEGIEDFSVVEGDLCLSAMSAHYLNINTLLVRRKEAADALHFAEDTNTYEEWECLGRLACAGRCAYFDYELAWQHAHTGHRLTDASYLDILTARIKIMQRVWGRNTQFLESHSEKYQKVLEELRLHKAGGLLLDGKTVEARQELEKLPHPPVPYIILSRLPGLIAKPLAGTLRRLRHLIR